MKNKKFFIIPIKLIISLSILFYLIKKVDWECLSRFKFIDIAIILILLGIVIILGCLSFANLSKAVSNLPFFKIIRIYLWGIIVGMFSFGVVGELYTIPLLHKNGLPLSHAISLSVIDKFLSLFIYVLCTLGAFLLFWKKYSIYALAVFLFVVTITLMFFYIKKLRKIIKVSIFDKYIPGTTETFQTFLNFFLYHKKNVIIKLILSSMRVFVSGVIIWYGIIVLGGKNDFIAVLFITTAAHLIAFIPISLNGLGIFEFSSTYALFLLGFSKNNVIISVLLARVLLWSLGFILFILLSFFWKNRNIKAINDEQKYP